MTGRNLAQLGALIARTFRYNSGSACGTRSPWACSWALGTSPSSGMRWRVRAVSGSGTGIADISDWVYGCIGCVISSSESAISTILPKYMTANAPGYMLDDQQVVRYEQVC